MNIESYIGLFEKDYTFKNRYADIVVRLTQSISEELSLPLFQRNIDLFIFAPIVGFVFGKSVSDAGDKSNTSTTKKINFDQINGEIMTLKFNYELIMLSQEINYSESLDYRLERAFTKKNDQVNRKRCDQIYESYLRGGLEILECNILNKSVTEDEYIKNTHNFLEEFEKQFNSLASNEHIYKLVNKYKLK